MGKVEIGAVQTKVKKAKKSEMEKLIDVCKPFVGALKGKSVPRAFLKTALVNEKYIIVTDAHRLIRITHNQEVKEPYLHHYKKELTENVDIKSYPDTSRLLPDTSNAQKEILIDVTEWLEAHELGLIAAKEQGKNKDINLKNNQFIVNAVKTFINKKGKEEKQPDYEQISFKYTLDNNTGIEKVTYSCEYMLDAMKVFKKLKIEQVKLYFYGQHRPMYFVGKDIEILILPVRTH